MYSRKIRTSPKFLIFHDHGISQSGIQGEGIYSHEILVRFSLNFEFPILKWSFYKKTQNQRFHVLTGIYYQGEGILTRSWIQEENYSHRAS